MGGVGGGSCAFCPFPNQLCHKQKINTERLKVTNDIHKISIREKKYKVILETYGQARQHISA